MINYTATLSLSSSCSHLTGVCCSSEPRQEVLRLVLPRRCVMGNFASKQSPLTLLLRDTYPEPPPKAPHLCYSVSPRLAVFTAARSTRNYPHLLFVGLPPPLALCSDLAALSLELPLGSGRLSRKYTFSGYMTEPVLLPSRCNISYKNCFKDESCLYQCQLGAECGRIFVTMVSIFLSINTDYETNLVF